MNTESNIQPVGTKKTISTNTEANLWSAIAHISGIAGWMPLFAFQLPLIGFSIVFPLFVFLLKKAQFEEVEQHAKEAVNFQITSTLLFMAFAFAIAVINKGASDPSLGIKVVTFDMVAAVILSLLSYIAFMIVGAINAYKGKPYQYLVNIRFIK